MGSDPVDVDKNGEQILEKGSTGPKLPKDYIRLMKDLELELLERNKQLVKQINEEHYQKKCLDLIRHSKTNYACLAAAKIMISSQSEYLADLKVQYEDMLNDLQLKNPMAAQACNLDEKKVSDMIDDICNNKSQKTDEKMHLTSSGGSRVPQSSKCTPSRSKSSRAHPQSGSGGTGAFSFDKENLPNNNHGN